MSSHDTPDASSPLVGLLQSALEGEREAIIAVDTRAGSILAANPIARALLGLDAGDLPVQLDRAMPAARSLRTIALAGDLDALPVTTDLVFWTSRGVIRLPATIERYGDASSRIVLVREQTGSHEEQPPLTRTRDQRAFWDGGEAGPFLAPSERDTLREIARRIREGQTAVVEPMSADTGRGSGNTQMTPVPARISGEENALGAVEAAPSSTSPSAIRAAATAEPATDDHPSIPDPLAVDGNPATSSNVEDPELNPGSSTEATPGAIPGGADINPEAPAPDALQRAKLAHELKTPIGAIATAAEIMAGARFGDLGDPRYRAYADEMLINARHALTLIDRMLARKPATGKEPPALHFERFDLNALVASSVSAVQATAAAKGIEIGTSLTAAAPRILADPTSIRQVLLNLLSNAVKFAPAAGNVAVATLEAPDGGAIIRVSDNGPGMSERDITAALRADAEHDIRQDRPGGGLGLGLAITRSLVEANGARLEFESHGGEGTTVTVRFSGGRLIVS